MTATGFLFFVSELAASNSAVVFTVSSLLGNLFIGVVIHMLLALPSGRLRSRAERALVVGIYAFTAPPSRGYLLFADPAETGCPECPRNLALIDANADLAHLIDTVINVVALVMVVVVMVILWRHWQVANGPERRAVGPVLFTGATVLVLLGLGIVAQLAADQDAAELGYYATQAAIGPLPYAFLASLARSRLTRGDAVSELVASLRRAKGQGEMRDALARALGDPTLELAYWLPEFESWADLSGRPVALADLTAGRATTLIDGDEGHIAALLHDPSLDDEPDLLQAVAAAAAIALENARLQVELRARVEELRGSRARLVEAADAERRRLERDLHDGAQQRMVAIALQLRLVQSRIRRDPDVAEQLVTTASDELALSLSELRELARGIHPAVLEHGLASALESLATRSTVPTTVSFETSERLPERVEFAAYFVASEALANVSKYAQATSVTMRVWRAGPIASIEIADDGIGGADDANGSGLRGLADRVEALDGTLRVISPPGAGTVVTASMPCGS
jgi:signal transduction histidine kinase